MPKIMNIFPSIFSGSKETKSTEGRLETDALPVVDNGTPDGNNGNNNTNFPPSISITPTVSADLTESVVRELSDPNYNSLELVESATIPGNALVNSHSNVVAPSSSASTTNTMNVHNAQQQVVMNFSNATGLHFGSVYNFNHDMSASSSRKNSCNTEESNSTLGTGFNRQMPRKTTTIVVMMQSRDEPNHRILDTVATHLGEGWKQVMRDLGHSEGQIEQAIIDHQMHGNIKEVIYQLLLQWLRNAEDGEATIGKLTTLLWETNHRECVQRMKLVWKALEKRKVTS